MGSGVGDGYRQRTGARAEPQPKRSATGPRSQRVKREWRVGIFCRLSPGVRAAGGGPPALQSERGEAATAMERDRSLVAAREEGGACWNILPASDVCARGGRGPPALQSERGQAATAMERDRSLVAAREEGGACWNILPASDVCARCGRGPPALRPERGEAATAAERDRSPVAAREEGVACWNILPAFSRRPRCGRGTARAPVGARRSRNRNGARPVPGRSAGRGSSVLEYSAGFLPACALRAAFWIHSMPMLIPILAVLVGMISSLAAVAATSPTEVLAAVAQSPIKGGL